MTEGTIVLDESCVELGEALGAVYPVYNFRRRDGFLQTHPDVAADELRDALVSRCVAAPYVLVAASFGGFMALAYASRYPSSLKGLVLVDSSHPEQSVASLAAIPASEPASPALECFKRYVHGFGPLWAESCASISTITQLGAVPLIVLAAGKPDLPAELSERTQRALTASWHELQRRHAALSMRGELRIVPGAGHNIVATVPEAILAAVTELSARSLEQR